MAGRSHVVDVPQGSPWPLVFELAESTPPGSWVLVGGLMVHLHALRAGVEAIRPTSDVDVLLDISSNSVLDVAGPLTSLGFSARDPSYGAPLHRFVRDERDVVDVMVARDVRTRTRWRRRPLLRSPGAAQALIRRDVYSLTSDGDSATIGVPDELGAIIAKSAAYATDSRDSRRHLDDLAVLAAATGNPRVLALDTLTRKDRLHLRRVLPHLSDDQHPSWRVLDRYDRTLGQRVWTAIAAACSP